MKVIVAALFAVVASLTGVFATAPCIIVDPTQYSVWPIGSVQLISWTNAVFTTIPVYLDDGSSSDYHINVPAVIPALPVSPNYYSFTVPSVLDGAPIIPGTYAIQFGIAPDVAYGGPVVITTAGEQVPPPPVTTTTPPAVVVVTTTTVVAAATTTTTAAAAATTTTTSSTAAAAATTTAAAPAKSSGSTISPLSLGALLVLVHMALWAL